MSNGNEKPIKFRELERRFEARDAKTTKPIGLERRFHIAADQEPRVRTRLERVERGDKSDWEVIVEVDGVRAGGRAIHPRRGWN